MPVAELLVGGILLGGVYALMACGLNLIFGVMRVINFAHGDILAIAALSTVSIAVGFKLPFWVAVVVVPIGCAVLGALIHVVILRRIEGAPMIMSLLATYALSTILVNVAILIWGGGYSGLPGVLGDYTGIGVHVDRVRDNICNPADEFIWQQATGPMSAWGPAISTTVSGGAVWKVTPDTLRVFEQAGPCNINCIFDLAIPLPCPSKN